MENNRPLQNLTDQELIRLWEMSVAVDDMGQDTIDHIDGYSADCLLTPSDIKQIRAGVLLQAKLCEKYGIPHPDIRLGVNEEELVMNGRTLDEELEDTDWEPFEYESTDLSITMNNFASVKGIGDFEEKYLFFDQEEFRPLFKDDAWEDYEDEEGDSDDEVSAAEIVEEQFAEELGYAGFRSLLDLVEELGPDVLDVTEVAVATSKKMASLLNAVKSGKVPGYVTLFWEGFSSKMVMRTYRWIPLGENEQIKDDAWCCVYVVASHSEEGIIICDLYKYMCTRIGAYIAQEFADRYAA